MAKILVLVVVVLLVAWLLIGRRRSPPDDAAAPPRSGRAKKPDPQALLACAHCGVQLPRAEALFDAAGRPFCSDAHRLAGPR
ncbi:MAG: hypothetical protein KIS83_05745 [Rubrivivax sp.]|nr:hypothetical protein [Rubrivivax sp.]MCW5610173.1 hypothetical protein [Rubrivivax sp.]